MRPNETIPTKRTVNLSIIPNGQTRCSVNIYEGTHAAAGSNDLLASRPIGEAPRLCEPKSCEIDVTVAANYDRRIEMIVTRKSPEYSSQPYVCDDILSRDWSVQYFSGPSGPFKLREAEVSQSEPQAGCEPSCTGLLS